MKTLISNGQKHPEASFQFHFFKGLGEHFVHWSGRDSGWATILYVQSYNKVVPCYNFFVCLKKLHYWGQGDPFHTMGWFQKKIIFQVPNQTWNHGEKRSYFVTICLRLVRRKRLGIKALDVILIRNKHSLQTSASCDICSLVLQDFKCKEKHVVLPSAIPFSLETLTT